MYCFIATEQERKGSSAGFVSPEGHHTMEFFEMCAALITQLARWILLEKKIIAYNI